MLYDVQALGERSRVEAGSPVEAGLDHANRVLEREDREGDPRPAGLKFRVDVWRVKNPPSLFSHTFSATVYHRPEAGAP